MTNDAEAVLQLSATLSLVGGLVGVLYYVWYALALSKLFAKLGAESWRGWVPILNEMEILTRGGVPGWSVVYYFIPVVNLYGLYLKITAVHRINVQLGRGVGMTVLAVVLPPVWASILAWGATPALAGVDDRRVEGGLASGDAPSQPSGPLGAPPAPAAAPFAPAASDASGYALPVVQPPPAAAPGPAFSAPAAAPSLPPAPSTAPPAPAAGLIQNPWAQPGTAAAQPAPPQPSAAPASATPPAPTAATTPPPPPAPPVVPAAAAPPAPPAPPTPAGPPAPPVDSGFIVPPPSIGLPPSASAPVAPPAPPAAPAAAPVFVPAPTPSSPPPAPSSTPAFFAPDNGGDDDLDNTIVVDRRPVVPWKLRTDDGFVASLTASKVVLGRNPSSGEMDVQAIAIPDSSKTLSKTHARLDLVDGAWTLTDLHSTNGVIVIEADGSENLIDVDQTVPLQSRFLLGKVGMAVSFEEEQGS